MAFSLQAPRVRGLVPVPAGVDGATLIIHLQTELRSRKCQARITGQNELVVERGTPGRGSVLAFVDDGGTIRLATKDTALVLAYDFSTAGGLQLCAILSPVCAAAAWFTLHSLGLTIFGAVMPLLWLYGANYLASCLRVPSLLAGLCRTAPRQTGAASLDPR